MNQMTMNFSKTLILSESKPVFKQVEVDNSGYIGKGECHYCHEEREFHEEIHGCCSDCHIDYWVN